MQGIERRFENEAAEVANAIRHFAQHPDALDDFESYLSISFDKWLEKFHDVKRFVLHHHLVGHPSR